VGRVGGEREGEREPFTTGGEREIEREEKGGRKEESDTRKE
jgi:hypothetical protein